MAENSNLPFFFLLWHLVSQNIWIFLWNATEKHGPPLFILTPRLHNLQFTSNLSFFLLFFLSFIFFMTSDLTQYLLGYSFENATKTYVPPLLMLSPMLRNLQFTSNLSLPWHTPTKIWVECPPRDTVVKRCCVILGVYWALLSGNYWTSGILGAAIGCDNGGLVSGTYPCYIRDFSIVRERRHVTTWSRLGYGARDCTLSSELERSERNENMWLHV